MREDKPKPNWLDELRRHAEESLGKKKGKNITGVDALAWVHELQVHQTELEMQNEELKCARQGLEESRNKYLELYEFSPIGYFTLDSVGTILGVNLSGAALLGVERGSLTGSRFQLFVEMDLRPDFNSFCNRVFGSDVKQTCELRLVKNNALLLYAYLEGIALRDGEGTVKQCQIAVVDITGRKHAEMELLERRRSLELEIAKCKRAEEDTNLLQIITKGIAEAEDLQTAFRIVLSKICESTGWIYGEAWCSSGEGNFLECHFTWCKPGEKLEEFSEKSKKFTFAPGVGLPGRVWLSKKPEWRRDAYVDGNFPRFEICKEFNLRGAMGIPVIANDEVIAVLDFFVRKPQELDERLIRLVSLIATQLGVVIKRKQAEQALRESDEKFRSITTSAFDAVIMMDDEGKISFWNEAAERMFGYSKDEAIGKSLHTLIVHNRFRDEYSKGFEKFKETGKGAIIDKVLVLPGLRKDGTEFYADHSFSVVKIKDKWHSMSIVRDITERKLRETRQTAQFAMSRIFGETATLSEALPQILKTICEGFGWELGELWTIDHSLNQLRLERMWCKPSLDASEFEKFSRTITFSRGTGLPGRVWSSKQSVVWITDVVTDSNFPRAAIALKTGLHGAVAFPLMIKDEVNGVMVFFSKKVYPIDEELSNIMSDIGRRVGSFIDRKLVEEKLRKVSLATEQSPSIVVITDIAGKIEYVNLKFTKVTGYTFEEAIGKTPRILKSGLVPHEVHKHLWDTITSGNEWRGEMINRRKNGDLYWETALISPIKDTKGAITHFVALSEDITNTKQTEEARARLSAIVETTTDFVSSADKDGKVFYINKAGREMLGIREDEDVARLKIGDCHPTWVNTLLVNEAISYAIKNGIWTGESALLRRDGREIPVSQVVIAHMKADGEVDYLSTIARNITERKQYESQIMYMANRDPLTNLFNRRRFNEELGNRIMQTKRFKTQGALLFIDIDNFKYVNDSLGHEMGDKLLVNVSNILKERLRDVDAVARLGGDEFAIILSDTDEQNAVQIANQLRELIRQNASIVEGKAVGISVSIGISLFPKHSEKTEEVSSYADLAMYQAKEEGRNRVCVYTKEQTTKIESRRIWEERIREALNQNSFVLHLQPIFDIQQNCISGYEVLVRMVGKKGEIIPPSQFIYIAERFGLIRDIDHWVVQESIALVKKLRQRGKPSQLEINLSGRVLNNKELLQLIKEKVAEAGIDPAGLVFEITETAAIENITEAESFIIELKRIGCRFALDDFGIGFSSVSYLKHLSVDYLKIDGSFIQNLPDNFTDQHLVKAMVEIAHGLRKKIIAEFVTSEKTLSLLQGFGVDYAQGYFIGKPKPLDEV